MRRAELSVVFLGLILAGASARLHLRAADTSADAVTALRQLLQSPDSPSFVAGDAKGARLWSEARQFYERRGFEPAWTDKGRRAAGVDPLIALLRDSNREGLDPQVYKITAIDERFSGARTFNQEDIAALEVSLTYLYMRYASDLVDGVSDHAIADPGWQITSRPFDPLPQLERALAENRIAESLAGLGPVHPEYRALRGLLADLKAQRARGGWPPVPAGLKLKPGERSASVTPLAARLAASGDYAPGPTDDDQPVEYSGDLQQAVKRFQQRHGMTPDAVVGPGLVAAMNVSIDERIRQVELNMERWRWLPRDLGERHILVNIPDMRLDVIDHGRVPLSMRVVVGKKATPTPIFTDQMTYLMFSPYWYVPPDIARDETLPAVLKDPGFLDRTNMELVDRAGHVLDTGSIDFSQAGKYRFRQRPGTRNSLGLVKFMFPNEFNVYLHDTPADSLFARTSRLFSHGCVRLEDPQKLAEYVLADQPEWTPERIDAAMHAGEQRTVKLLQPIPVYIGYWTARAAADGTAQFRSDVYGLDGRQATNLAHRLDRLRRSAGAMAEALLGKKPGPAAAGQ